VHRVVADFLDDRECILREFADEEFELEVVADEPLSERKMTTSNGAGGALARTA
jgi:hypothetical protein